MPVLLPPTAALLLQDPQARHRPDFAGALARPILKRRHTPDDPADLGARHPGRSRPLTVAHCPKAVTLQHQAHIGVIGATVRSALWDRTGNKTATFVLVVVADILPRSCLDKKFASP